MVLIFSVSLMHSHITWCDCALRRQKKLIPYLAALTLRKFLWVSCCTIPRVFCGSLNLPCWHSRLFLGKWTFLSAHFVKVVYISCCFGLFSTLAPDAICTACGYQASDGRWVKPMWTGGSSAQTYYPSYNLAPTTFRFHLWCFINVCLNLLLNAHIFC